MEYVLAIALLTWGGVFFYLLRMEALARALEKQIATLHNDAPQEPPRETLNV